MKNLVACAANLSLDNAMSISRWQRAKKYGIDTLLLEASLSKTPTERVMTLQSAVAFAEKLRLAGAKYYAITDLGFIDFLGSVSGLGTYEKLPDHTIKIDLFGRKCRVLDLESLIRSKKKMAREKDKHAVVQLMAIKEKLGK